MYVAIRPPTICGYGFIYIDDGEFVAVALFTMMMEKARDYGSDSGVCQKMRWTSCAIR